MKHVFHYFLLAVLVLLGGMSSVYAQGPQIKDGIVPSKVVLTIGNRTMILTAKSKKGLLKTDAAPVSLVQSANPPVAVISSPEDTLIEQTSAAGALVTFNGSTSFDPDGDELSYLWFEGIFGSEEGEILGEGAIIDLSLSAGTHTISLLVIDAAGDFGVASLNVLVADTTPPAITLNGSDTVEVEQGSSYTELGATVSDIVDPFPSLVISGSVDSSTAGEYTIEYTATDASGNQTSKARLVRVVSTAPPATPTIIVKHRPTILWPPYHQYEKIDVDDIIIRVYDSQNRRMPKGKVTIQSVSSDEPEDAPGLGDGKTKNDIAFGHFYNCGHKHKHKKGDARAVYVRAERQGSGNGRVYTITLEVEDAFGAVGTAAYEVWVPRNKRDNNVINDGPSYTEYPSNAQNFSDNDLDKESLIGQGDVATVFALHNNYPNPFNPSTEIQFSIVDEGMTTLRVYDMLGRLVETLVEDQLPAGEYTVTFNAKGLSSGMYIYRLHSGQSVQTKRMMLMK